MRLNIRFFLVKHEQTCKVCGVPMLYGEEAVFIRTVIVKQTGNKMSLTYHPQCYLRDFTESFNGIWINWRNGVTPRPPKKKRGRKYLYKSREIATEINRLKALQRYHTRMNRMDRVLEIQSQIKEILNPEQDFAGYMEEQHQKREAARLAMNQAGLGSEPDNKEGQVEL